MTPRFALSYALSDEARVYAQAAKGFRTGGPNLTASTLFGIPSTYEPDSLWNYELGLKSHWLDRRLVFNAAVYYIDWQDLQLEPGQQRRVLYGQCRRREVLRRRDGNPLAHVIALDAGLVAVRRPCGADRKCADADASDGSGRCSIRAIVCPRRRSSPARPISQFQPTTATTLRAEHGYVGSSYVDFDSAGPKLGDYHLVNLRGTLRVSSVDLMLYVDNVLNDDARTTATIASSLAGQLLFPAVAVQLQTAHVRLRGAI